MPTTFNPRRYLLSIITLASGTLITASAHAEPGVSLAHIPFLWALGTAVAALLSLLVVYILTRLGLLQSPSKRWITSIILFVVFIITIVPIVTVIGSILITGRTM